VCDLLEGLCLFCTVAILFWFAVVLANVGTTLNCFPPSVAVLIFNVGYLCVGMPLNFAWLSWWFWFLFSIWLLNLACLSVIDYGILVKNGVLSPEIGWDAFLVLHLELLVWSWLPLACLNLYGSYPCQTITGLWFCALVYNPLNCLVLSDWCGSDIVLILVLSVDCLALCCCPADWFLLHPSCWLG
jgi:hypothetical protein